MSRSSPAPVVRIPCSQQCQAVEQCRRAAVEAWLLAHDITWKGTAASIDPRSRGAPWNTRADGATCGRSLYTPSQFPKTMSALLSRAYMHQ